MCERYKPVTEFYKDGRAPDGLTRRCKDCHIRKSYESRKKSESPSARRDYAYNLRLKREYGLSLDDYNEMLEAQNGVCLICDQPETMKKWWGDEAPRLHVDHDHFTGKIRGLLCSNCNTGLGKFRDSPRLLRRAEDYLRGETTAVMKSRCR